MRTAELKPSTMYVTADKYAVQTLNTVERDWLYLAAGDDREVIRSSGATVEQDPWSMRPKRHREKTVTIGNRVWRILSEGVKVKAFPRGDDGQPDLDKPKIIAIDPVQIKGTWEQYAELYSDEIEHVAMVKNARAELVAAMAAIPAEMKTKIEAINLFWTESADGVRAGRVTSYVGGYDQALSVTYLGIGYTQTQSAAVSTLETAIEIANLIEGDSVYAKGGKK